MIKLLTLNNLTEKEMKKLFLTCGVAAMTLIFASCDHSSAGAGSFNDSISTSMGEVAGSTWNQQFQMAPAEQLAHFNKADVIRGFKDFLMNNDTASMGYSVGVQAAHEVLGMVLQLESVGIDVDRSKLVAAFAKTLTADSISAERLQAIQSVNQKLMGQAQQKAIAVYEAKNQAAQAAQEEAANAAEESNKAFFEELKKDPEVKFTESGLAYKVKKAGTGATAKADSNVKLMYKGQLIDGTVFDKSESPVEFQPDHTVRGFSEGLQMMNAGSEYILYIPAELGYGSRENGRIPANSVLIFEVSVESID